MNRAEYERIAKTVSTFVAVLLVVLYAIAVTSRNALKGPDAFTLRWTVISLAVGVSAFAAWVRWTMLRPRLSTPSTPSSSSPPIHATNVAPAAVVAAGRQAVLFRQHFPPQPQRSTLSFFGGAPVAATGFRWPRARSTDTPFSFLMQIDCAEVPPAARLGMLPDRGVLYFFLDLTLSQTDLFRVLYEEGKDNDWRPIQPPEDLGSAFGKHAPSVWKWTQSLQDCPTLLPTWTFQPVAIAIPPEVYDRAALEDPDAPLWWPGEKVMAQPLLAAQGEEVVGTSSTVQEFIDASGAMRRPFANYPHDWRAIQICSGLLLERVVEPNRLPSTFALRELSEADRNALVARIRDDARRWFDRAAAHSPFAAVPEVERDQFWSWLADKTWLVRFVIRDALTMSIEASLTASPEAAARMPADIVRRVHARHALAFRWEHGIFVTTPHRMLAPPVDVQGHQWERAKTHLLLLEISSNEALGHHFGEGVFQFWITPDNLKARRFDKVELTADAY